MAQATVIVPSQAQYLLTGISRIEITPRTLKAWGALKDEAPLYFLTRKSAYGNIQEKSFVDLAELLRSKGERRR